MDLTQLTVKTSIVLESPNAAVMLVYVVANDLESILIKILKILSWGVEALLGPFSIYNDRGQQRFYMSYKFSKGSQVIGDLKAADDTQRDTQIDFGEDEIAFDTSGSTRIHIANSVITTTVPIHISGSEIQGLKIS